MYGCNDSCLRLEMIPILVKEAVIGILIYLIEPDFDTILTLCDIRFHCRLVGITTWFAHR